MSTASQQVSESASQPGETEAPLGIVATEDESQFAAMADLERRVRELEAAIGEVRSVKASAAVGRKTSPTVMAGGVAGVDDALGSLSVEQRIAVKSGLIRAGLL